MRRFLTDLRCIALAAIAALCVGSLAVSAQGFVLPSSTGILGFLLAEGKQPIGTGCTMAAGSTDAAGMCTATAASGSIAFAKLDLANAPFCNVVDSSATPIMVYTVTTLQITLTTITSGHVLRYWCVAQAGN